MSEQTTSGTGTLFHRFLGAITLSHVGNGIHAVAFPLLAASLTGDPRLIAGLATAGMLPGLLLAVPAGAIVDRVDRGRLLVVVDAGRAVVLGLLVTLIATGALDLWHLFVAVFLLGLAELLFDTALVSFVPALVESRQLPRANGRLRTAAEFGNGIVGPAVGGALFGMLAALPFLLNGMSAFAAAVLLAWVAWRRTARPAARVEPTPARAEGDAGADAAAAGADAAAPDDGVLAGFRWLRDHPRMAVLALVVGGWNLFGWMPEALLVLYAEHELGVGGLGFGLLFGASSVGAALGGLWSGWLIDRWGMSGVMRAALWSFALFAFPPAFLSAPVLVGGVFLAQGTFMVCWAAVSMTIRQTLVPDDVLGRVNAAFFLLGAGIGPIGLMLGGVLGQWLGLRPVFVVSGIGLTLLALLCGRPLGALAAEAASEDEG